MWKYRGQHRPPFAETPSEDQESVWDYPRPPLVVSDERRVVVRSGNTVLADTTRSLRVLETASPPTFYIPVSDIVTEQLVPARGGSVCEWKGAARYWSLRGAEAHGAIGWSYPQPSKAFEALLDHIAFYPGRVECFVDDERVAPQPGRFYGGWITAELTGPFKGEPGSEGW